MTNTLLKSNNIYGTQIGHKTIFTEESALERYKAFLEHIYNSTGFDKEGALVLDQVEQDMIAAGFTYEELEAVENEFLASV